MRLGALAIIAALLLGGCSAATPDAGNHRITVVTTTDAYGSIARAIGGTLVNVTSLVAGRDVNPHLFVPDAVVASEVAAADIVIVNGNGYDDWIDPMLSAADSRALTVLNVAEMSGKPHGPAVNDHLWYDFPTMQILVAKLVSALAAKDPAHASDFEGHANNFITGLSGLMSRTARLHQLYAGREVIATETAPYYVLKAAGLVNVASTVFTSAIEAGREVTPAVLNGVITPLLQKDVTVVLYNSQVAGPQAAAVLEAARSVNARVVMVGESVPAGETYLTWMGSMLHSLERAFRKH